MLSSDFLALCKTRRSIRSYSTKEVTQEQIVALLEAAQAAPSGGNCQPWHFFVIKDQSIKQRVVAATGGRQSFILDAPVLFVVCCDIKRSEQRYHERGRTLYCIQDTAAAIQNMLLCARSLGLGSCWCGAFAEQRVVDVLQLPSDFRPVALIPIGYPAGEMPETPDRRPLDEIATFI